MSIITKTLLAATFMTSSALANESIVQPHQSGNITYVTGGVGDEEREAMRSIKNNYNLSVMSSDKSGAYVGDARVAILDQAGDELLSTQVDPLFYAELPPGNYIIKGSSAGQSRKQNVHISEGKTSQVHFAWSK